MPTASTRNHRRRSDTDRSAYAPLRAVLTKEERNAYIAAGKALAYLMKMEQNGVAFVERESVYGAAIAIPQIARSCGWNSWMTALVIRSYFFLFMNVIIQAFLLMMILEHKQVMQPMGGQMHLCDFGRDLERCPHGSNCVGPGGTVFTPPRLYAYSVWNSRLFVRDSLLQVYPERSEEIRESVDPGEYGMESHSCRLICVFLFILSLLDDLQKSMGLLTLLFRAPSSPGQWISYEVPSFASKDRVKSIHGWTELDLVKFRVAGMPRGWKVVSALAVLLPKMLIWWTFAFLGAWLLMDTAGILDGLMHSLALVFILEVDEVIFALLTTIPVKHMMRNLEDLSLFDTQVFETEDDDDILARYLVDELGDGKVSRCCRLMFPKRLAIVLFMLWCCVWYYYHRFCVQSENGAWVSTPMFMPESARFSLKEFLFPSSKEGIEPFWRMPDTVSES